MTNPGVCVLKTDGINCDMEMAYAFETAGAETEIVHVNQLRDRSRNLRDYGALAIPGGFSYGDDIASGKVLANELTSYLGDQLQGFVDDEKPVLGVCNGFQVLARTGLLPNRTVGEQHVTLAENDIGRFVCRWVDLEVQTSNCKFAHPGDFAVEGEKPVPMQIAHGEGRFTASRGVLRALNENHQIVFKYSGDNPNGSAESIAGICNESGLVLGMMPHPERSISAFHPDRARTHEARRVAKTIFSSIVLFTKES